MRILYVAAWTLVLAGCSYKIGEFKFERRVSDFRNNDVYMPIESNGAARSHEFKTARRDHRIISEKEGDGGVLAPAMRVKLRVTNLSEPKPAPKEYTIITGAEGPLKFSMALLGMSLGSVWTVQKAEVNGEINRVELLEVCKPWGVQWRLFANQALTSHVIRCKRLELEPLAQARFSACDQQDDACEKTFASFTENALDTWLTEMNDYCQKRSFQRCRRIYQSFFRTSFIRMRDKAAIEKAVAAMMSHIGGPNVGPVISTVFVYGSEEAIQAVVEAVKKETSPYAVKTLLDCVRAGGNGKTACGEAFAMLAGAHSTNMYKLTGDALKLVVAAEPPSTDPWVKARVRQMAYALEHQAKNALAERHRREKEEQYKKECGGGIYCQRTSFGVIYNHGGGNSNRYEAPVETGPTVLTLLESGKEEEALAVLRKLKEDDEWGNQRNFGTNSKGYNILHIAAEKDMRGVARELLKKFPDLALQESNGRSRPAEVAFEAKHESLAREIREVEDEIDDGSKWYSTGHSQRREVNGRMEILAKAMDRKGHQAVRISPRKALILGGDIERRVEIWDAQTGKTVAVRPMHALHANGVAGLGRTGKVIVISKHEENAKKEWKLVAEDFDPDLRKWGETTQIPINVGKMGPVKVEPEYLVLKHGGILVAYFQEEYAEKSTAAWINLAVQDADGTRIIGRTAFLRNGFKMAELPDGKIVIAGGQVNFSGQTDGKWENAKELEIFDPSTGLSEKGMAATQTPQMLRGALALDDGRVITYGPGGLDLWDLEKKTAARFNPLDSPARSVKQLPSGQVFVLTESGNVVSLKPAAAALEKVKDFPIGDADAVLMPLSGDELVAFGGTNASRGDQPIYPVHVVKVSKGTVFPHFECADAEDDSCGREPAAFKRK